ncbi:TPA: hypothetical protein P0E12_004984 [Vibrio harveyi]|nr:hypothetical protein [Vibrio harveyi]
MAHVVGIPVTKGNGHVILPVKLEGDVSRYSEGQFVAFSKGTPQSSTPYVNALAAETDNICGVIMDINPCAKTASLVTSAHGVVVPAVDDKKRPTNGDPVKIDIATGFVSTEGTLITNAQCTNHDVRGLNGKTGKEIPACLMLSFQGLRNITPEVNPASPAPIPPTDEKKSTRQRTTPKLG